MEEFNHDLEMKKLTDMVINLKDGDLRKYLKPNPNFYNTFDNTKEHINILDITYIDIIENQCSILDICCRKNYINVVEQILKFPEVNPSINNNHPLYVALVNDNLEIIKLLIKHKNIKITYNLFEQVFEKKKDIKFLIELLNGNLVKIDINYLINSRLVDKQYKDILEQHKTIQIKLQEYNKLLDNNKKLEQLQKEVDNKNINITELHRDFDIKNKQFDDLQAVLANQKRELENTYKLQKELKNINDDLVSRTMKLSNELNVNNLKFSDLQSRLDKEEKNVGELNLNLHYKDDELKLYQTKYTDECTNYNIYEQQCKFTIQDLNNQLAILQKKLDNKNKSFEEFKLEFKKQLSSLIELPEISNNTN